MPKSLRDVFSSQFDNVLLTHLEVAALLKVHPNAINRWTDLPVAARNRRNGRLYRVRDVAEWLENRGPKRLAA